MSEFGQLPTSSLSRRAILKLGALLSAFPVLGSPALSEEVTLSNALAHFAPPKDKHLSPEWLASLRERGKPTVWETAEERRFLGIPAGGIGSGTVYYGADGRLWCWDIFNVHHEGVVPHIANGPEADFGKVRERDGANYLEPSPGKSPWNLENGFSLHFSDGSVRRLDASGFRNISCTGQYPAPEYRYTDKDSPISATLTGVAPFIPLDYDTSSLPVTFQVWTLTNNGSVPVSISLEGRIENGSLKLLTNAPELNRRCRFAMHDGNTIVVGDVVTTDAKQPSEVIRSRGDFGSIAIALIGEESSAPVRLSKMDEKQLLTVATQPVSIPAGASRTFTFVLGWHFPQVDERITHGTGSMPGARRWVSKQFRDAEELVAYVALHANATISTVYRFRDTWYGMENGADRGMLPHWLLERALWTSTTLTTNASYRLDNGKFWAWEGVGTCQGTCMHVYHYGQAMGRLFPEIERQLRERTDFDPIAFRADGSVDFRGGMQGNWAVDAQAGLILRCWRQHCTDASEFFLADNWISIRKAMQFLINLDAAGKTDGPDGVLTGSMHNTLDANWSGEVPWFISLYNASLIAAASMADEIGDKGFASQCRGISAKGKQAYAKLFQPQLGYYVANATPQQMLPIHVGHGCHIDQALGDWWLMQAGLQLFADKEQLRSAMFALYENNFVPDMEQFRSQWAAKQRGRPYAVGHESGLVMCTWPQGGLPDVSRNYWSFGYFQECMSGFEYTAAGLMVGLANDENDPLLLHGLSIARAVHDRYNAAKRNPYNEIECSDHYGRAMASYGVLIAACGFHCHRPSGLLRFAPKMNRDDFVAPFITGDAWGRFSQKYVPGKLTAAITVHYGVLKLGILQLLDLGQSREASLTVDGREIAHSMTASDGMLVVTMDVPQEIPMGSQVLFVSSSTNRTSLFGVPSSS